MAEVVPEEAEWVQKDFEAYANGNQSDREIAEMLNEGGIPTRTKRAWSKDSVRDFLQNEFYLGMVKYQGDLLPGKHPAVITQELFDRAQAAWVQRQQAPRRYTHKFKTYVVAGLLRCDRCDETLRAQSSWEYRYYRELTNTRGLHCDDSGQTVKADKVEEQIGVIVRQLHLPEHWQEHIREALLSGDEREKTLTHKKAFENKLHRLGTGFADGVLNETTYNREREVVQAELARLVIPEDVAVVDA